MKRIIILGVLAQLAIGSAFAQRENAKLIKSDTIRSAAYDEVSHQLNGTVVDNNLDPRAKYNWFIDISAGGGFYAAELNRLLANPISRLRPAVQLSVGKWVLPHWGIRYAIGYNKLASNYYVPGTYNMYDQTDHSVMPAEMNKDIVNDPVSGCSYFHRKFQVLDNQIDIVYDFNNLFTKRKTPLDLYLYGGVGYAYCFKSQGIESHSTIAFKLGFDAHYNVAKNLYIKAGVEGTINDESLDGQIGGMDGKTNRTVEGYATAFVGVGVKLGRQETRKYTYVGEDNINRTYKVAETVTATDYSAPFVVRFFIDQYNIESDQELNIAKVCKYLQEHPNARLLMTGHADPETATAKYNQALSERRCASVLKYIDKHYGISHDRIDVKPMGDTQRNFNEDFRWNRCVLLTIIDK